MKRLYTMLFGIGLSVIGGALYVGGMVINHNIFAFGLYGFMPAGLIVMTAALFIKN